MNIKHNIPLVVGLAIPVLMIVFVVASIYLPRLWATPPQYDFIYASNTSTHYTGRVGDQSVRYELGVRDGQLQEAAIPLPDDSYKDPFADRPQLYRYDVQTNTSQVIPLEEAKLLRLDDNEQSPDGFTISPGARNGGLFPLVWSENDYSTRYLKSKQASYKINVNVSHDYYNGFRLIGWILP